MTSFYLDLKKKKFSLMKHKSGKNKSGGPKQRTIFSFSIYFESFFFDPI